MLNIRVAKNCIHCLLFYYLFLIYVGGYVMNNLLMEVENEIAVVTINRPKSLNALNSETLAELDACFSEISERKDIKVVILTGSGAKAFVAGADISEMVNATPAEGRKMGMLAKEAFLKLETMPQVTIAAVNGFALGGGCEISMACDIRIASAKAKFGQPEVGLGITPGFSGTQRLPRLVGLGKAKELIYTAAVIHAEEACRIGLVNKVVEPEELMNECMAMAKTIAAKAPLAVRYAKEAINRGVETDMDTGIVIENGLFGLCFATTDQKEGMEAFLWKRKPEFKGN